MSGAIEVTINDTLLEALQSKGNEFTDKFTDLGNDIALTEQNAAKDEAPYITHTLERAISVMEVGPPSWTIAPDEGIAPYALFVILDGVNRKYEGNDFMQRGYDKSQGDVESKIADFEEWCGDV